MSFFGPIKKVHNHNPPRISIYDNKTNKSVNPWEVFNPGVISKVG